MPTVISAGPVNDFRASGLAAVLNYNLQLRQLFASVQSAANQQRDFSHWL